MKKLMSLCLSLTIAMGCAEAQAPAQQQTADPLRADREQLAARTRDVEHREMVAANLGAGVVHELSDADLSRLHLQRIPDRPVVAPRTSPSPAPSSGGEATVYSRTSTAPTMAQPVMRRIGYLPAQPTGVADDAMFLNPPWNIYTEGRTHAIALRLDEDAYAVEVLVDGRYVCAYGGGFPSPQGMEETRNGGLSQNCAVPPMGGAVTYYVWVHTIGRHTVTARYLAPDPFGGVQQAACTQTTTVNTGDIETLSHRYANGGSCPN